jgi:hypothetical protein
VTITGPDVSDRQAGLSVASVKQAGHSFLTARALSFPQGLMQADPAYSSFRDQCKALGFPFAAYVLVHTYVTPAATAALLAKTIGDPAIPVMIDLEPDSDTPTVGFAVQCFDAFAAEGLQPRVLYDPRWYWSELHGPSLTARPWRVTSSDYGSNAPGGALSRYTSMGGDTGPGWEPYGGLTPTFWQFGSQIVLGTDSNGHTVYGDCNAYRGTLDELVTTGLFTDWGHTLSSPADFASAFWQYPTENSVGDKVVSPAVQRFANAAQQLWFISSTLGTISAQLTTTNNLLTELLSKFPPAP